MRVVFWKFTFWVPQARHLGATRLAVSVSETVRHGARSCGACLRNPKFPIQSL